MTIVSQRKKFRSLLNSGNLIVAPGAYDPITARVAELLGFEVVYMGGMMTGVHLTTTEPLTTMTEQVEAARWVVRSVDIPLVVDGDAGFGDPVHTMRCVREFEAAGVTGIHIEDQFFPKRVSYFTGLEHITSRHEFSSKIKFALQARRDPDFVMIGRTDAFRAVESHDDPMGEAIYRGNMLKDLGVDMILPIGIREPMDYERFRKGVSNIPLMALSSFTIGGALSPVSGLRPQQVYDLGYQFVTFALVTHFAALDGVIRVYSSLKENGTLPFDPKRIEVIQETISRALRLPELYEIERGTTEAASQ